MTDGIEQARAEIAQTREALARTTTALVAKADVKGRTKAKIQQEQVPLAVLAGVSALVLALLFWRRRR
jgi:hypothetical protein